MFEPGTDGQEQDLGQRPPAAEQGWRTGRKEGHQDGGCWAPRGSHVGWRALWKAGVALSEVFMCVPVFEILRWGLIAVWGNIRGTAHTPSCSAR